MNIYSGLSWNAVICYTKQCIFITVVMYIMYLAVFNSSCGLLLLKTF